MTENQTIPDAKRDGKAQAAADKAYRKASRPWFKKKRFLLPLILLVIIIITSVSNGGKKNSLCHLSFHRRFGRGARCSLCAARGSSCGAGSSGFPGRQGQ